MKLPRKRQMLWGCEFNIDHLGKHVFKLKIFWMNDKQLLDLAIIWYDDVGALLIPYFPPPRIPITCVYSHPFPSAKSGESPPPFFFPEGGGGLAQATVISHEKEKLVKFVTYNM